MAESGAGEDDGSVLRVAADEGEMERHEVFMAQGDIPLRAFAQKAEEVGFEVARDVGDARGLGVFGHVLIMPKGGAQADCESAGGNYGGDY